MKPSLLALVCAGAMAPGTPGVTSQAGSHVVVIANANVIASVDRPAQRRDRVVVERGRIACIGSTTQCPAPADARVIEARGKWVMPGLIDAHVHIGEPAKDAERIAPLYLAFGITTIRDTGGYPDVLRRLREGFDSGRSVGPRLFMAARPLDGDPSKWAGLPDVARRVRTRDDVVDAIAEAKRDGADFIKLYGGLSRELLMASIAEAHRQGLKTTADLMEWEDTGTVDALVTAGLDAFEHNIPEHYGRWERDAPRFRALVPLLVREHVAVTWTLTLIDRPATNRSPATAPTFLAMSPAQRRATEDMWHDHKVSEATRTWYAAVWPTAICNAARLFHRSGGVSLAGTDSPWYCCLPGDLLEELQHLVTCGLPPSAALAAATINPASWLGATDLGALRVGAAADLLVLDGNPLDDIRNIRRIAYVVSRGTVWKPADLVALANRPAPAGPRRH